MRRRRPMPSGKAARTTQKKHIGNCPDCGKLRFLDRASARRAARGRHPDVALIAYRCGDYWHYGNNFRK